MVTPGFKHPFSGAHLQPAPRGEGRWDPERPWLHRNPIQSIAGFPKKKL